MSIESRMTRCPRPFAPDVGQEALTRLPGLSPALAELIVGTAGSSPYLKGLIEGQAEWVAQAMGDPDTALSGVFEQIRAVPPDELHGALRGAKARVALLTALCDLAGVWPLEKVTGALTDLAGLACDLALKAEIAKLIKRGKLPGQSEADVGEAAGLSVLAMGKMGAHELNYSSDIDLICLFDETRYGPDDYMEARSGLVRATRNMCAVLNDRSAEGYVFRTDLRLRPDPAVTPVCMAMTAAETYYESLGRTWERAAYIKARPAAGDIAAGEKFLATLRPFVWRRHLDFAAIQDAHDIRLRIRESKGLSGPVTVPGHDMKLGRGGIREIEFFTQTRQLIAGGRDETLRARATCDGLAALAARGWVPPDVASVLSAHYRAHREVEHRIQMINDAQTHKMPGNDEGLERIACLMGRDRAELMGEVAGRLSQVHELTEGFFAPDQGKRADAPEVPEMPEGLDPAVLGRWHSYPALRSARAQEIFERLRPELMRHLARAARPDEALLSLDGFLKGLPAGVQLFSLFEANPQLIELLMDIVATAPALAEHLARNASVFDAVIGGDFFADWPGAAQLGRELRARLAAEADYETQLDAARRWTKETHFRIGVHHLRGLIDARDAGLHYADLAEAVLAEILPVVETQFARRHGPPPGRGAAVIGMGSLGERRLNAQSDLDLIVIYDPEDQDMSEGERPLPSRTYFARLTQALITALTAPMSQGRLYEVDMRLRPSGNQGPVATSWQSFQDYQLGQAWVWEHLALTRARVICGGQRGLGAEIEAFRQQILGAPRERDTVLEEVQSMRRRIAEAKASEGVWDVKTGAGRMQDLEIFAQGWSLLDPGAGRDVAGGLEAGVALGGLAAQTAVALRKSYDLYWTVVAALRLLSHRAMADEAMGEGETAFLCRASGFESIQRLEQALETAYKTSAAQIEASLNGYTAEKAP